jgi:hypothetical protein
MPDSEWADVAYLPGNGNRLDFSAPVTTNQQFFRVRETVLEPLALRPAVPVLTNGSVSLPDATVGAPYTDRIAPEFSGVPPYAIGISGSPPDGLNLEIVSNSTANASVQIHSSGTGLTAGQRRQFAIAVVDSLNTSEVREYDLRVISPPPQVTNVQLMFKAGELTSVNLVAAGGTAPLSWSVVSGTLPDGMMLSADGLLSGTPTPDAAEWQRDGRFTNVIQVVDSLTDRVTGAPSFRTATNTMQTLVRLSYRLNIRASRANGPSFLDHCFGCHGSFFYPDVESESALALINVNSGSGQACGIEGVYVKPGLISESLIYQKLSTSPPCGERMPRGGPYLSDTRIEQLARWIRELTETDSD